MASEAPPPQQPDLPALRAPHEDRDAVAAMLRVAADARRPSAGDLDERLEAALTARTYADLAILPQTGLPLASQHAQRYRGSRASSGSTALPRAPGETANGCCRAESRSGSQRQRRAGPDAPSPNWS